eukprot:TRINITY_DN1875_c0_g3_i1.p1 TRINITY_DN1875_c0_g3~~TRINITY_DN1875_c0_g3_i1.p1  ORF type:complete len:652 (+),score=61.62 TRINITY_DN1875_c0_g3_i1:54-2009(+)
MLDTMLSATLQDVHAMRARHWKACFLIMLLLTEELSIPTLAHRHNRRPKSGGTGDDDGGAGGGGTGYPLQRDSAQSDEYRLENPQVDSDCSEALQGDPHKQVELEKPLLLVRTFGIVRFDQPSDGGSGTQIELRTDTTDLYLEFSSPRERVILDRHARIALEHRSSGGVSTKTLALVLKNDAKEVAIFAPAQKSWWRRHINRTAEPPLEITEFSANHTPKLFNYTGRERDEQWLMHLLQALEFTRSGKFAPSCLRDGTCVQQCAEPTCNGENCTCFPPFFCELAVSESGAKQCTEVKAVDHVGSTYDEVVYAGVDDSIKRALKDKSADETSVVNALKELSQNNHGELPFSRLPRFASERKGDHGSVIRDETNLVWAWEGAMKYVSELILAEPDLNSCPKRKSVLEAKELVDFMLQLLVNVEAWKTSLPAFVELASNSEVQDRLKTMASTLEQRIEQVAANAGTKAALLQLSAGTHANMTIEPIGLCLALAGMVVAAGLTTLGYLAKRKGWTKLGNFLYVAGSITFLVSSGAWLVFGATSQFIAFGAALETVKASGISMATWQATATLYAGGVTPAVTIAYAFSVMTAFTAIAAPFILEYGRVAIIRGLDWVCAHANVTCTFTKRVKSLRILANSSNLSAGNSSNQTTPDDC